MKRDHREFIGAEHTVHFIRVINDIFDVLTSTISSVSKENPLKRPMCLENIDKVRDLFKEYTEYIKSLQIRKDNRQKIPLYGFSGSHC